MTGGLIQIVAYGLQDLFLTAMPEITFFKYIYKRYTNFAEESIDLNFDGTCNFGEEITCTFPKNGDIIKDIFVNITLPTVSLQRDINEELINKKIVELNEENEKYTDLNSYFQYLYTAIKISNRLMQQSNVTFSMIKKSIEAVTDINAAQFILTKLRLDANDITSIDFITNLNTINNSNLDEMQKINDYAVFVRKYINESNIISKKIQKNIIDLTNDLSLTQNRNHYFSWIENIGYKLLENIDIEIGGNIIDRQYGKWLFIWNELAENIYKKKTIDKLIGNVPELTTYNRDTKESYNLFIPLKFWFNRDYGVSIPLISLRFQDLVLRLKLSSLKECIYTDYDNTKNDLIDKIKIYNMSVMATYIYLDNDERKKFAKASHEYLIEQTKNNYFEVAKSKNINLDLDFYHPLKYIVWTIQRSRNVSKNLHFRYSNNTSNIVNFFPEIDFDKNNTVSQCRLELNGINRIEYQDGIYFNYIQPLECFSKTPVDGINVYSFSLNPLEIQPSGSCNFSKLNKKTLNIVLTDEFYNNIVDDEKIIINVYGINYNILRFSNGLAGLGFNF